MLEFFSCGKLKTEHVRVFLMQKTKEQRVKKKKEKGYQTSH